MWHERGCPMKSAITLDCLELQCWELTGFPRNPEEILEVGHAVLMSGNTSVHCPCPVCTHRQGFSVSLWRRFKVRGEQSWLRWGDAPEPLELLPRVLLDPVEYWEAVVKREKVPLAKIRPLAPHLFIILVSALAFGEMCMDVYMKWEGQKISCVFLPPWDCLPLPSLTWLSVISHQLPNKANWSRVVTGRVVCLMMTWVMGPISDWVQWVCWIYAWWEAMNSKTKKNISCRGIWTSSVHAVDLPPDVHFLRPAHVTALYPTWSQ